jgi:pimeloyl-ACP methyl ester carboxylesterase
MIAIAPQTQEQMRARYPEREGTVVRDGVRIAYEAYGAGTPAILLMPTWSIIHARHWKSQIPSFARAHTIVTFDGRGNGRSDRPAGPAAYADAEFVGDALAVMDALGIDRVVVAGFSMGAGYGLLLAATHPERVAGLICIGPAVSLDPPRPDRLAEFEAEPPTNEGWDRYNAHAWARDWPGFVEFFMGQVASEPHSTKQTEDMIGWALETDSSTITASERAPYLEAPAAADLVGAIRCPVLVIQGTDDRIQPADGARRFAAALGARLELLDGSGHAPMARDPIRVNLLILEFLATLDPVSR